MNDKKNIDRLFQEKFKDFETEPNKHVWINIQTALQEKKKERKVIPFWIKSSGIAAAFLLGLFALNTVLNNNNNIELKNGVVIDSKILKNSFDGKDSTLDKTKKERNPLEIKKIPQVVVSKIKTAKRNEKEITSSDRFKINSNKEKNQNGSVVYFQKDNSPLKPTTANNNNQKSTAVIAEKNNATTYNPFENIQQNQTQEKNGLKEVENSKIAAIESKKQPSSNTETPNELEEILKNKKGGEKDALVLNQKNKWQITPNIAAVYLNSNSGGSAIDPQLSENQKTTDNGLSFGIGVNYAISKKMVLRSGINKLTVGYNTNDVLYSAGLSSNNLANVTYTSNTLIEIKNQAALNTLTTFEKDLQKTNTGVLNQKMGYYEVPLELSYAVLDKKFGINIIGGVSTLFLNQNKISLVSSETNVKLGEAKNLNQVHFSTNVGLGFKYQIIKSFQINVEPMVKYQLNTFSNNSGDFKPLFIGLYSGISYSF
ncbi:hypothetical protein E0I26_00615 [Flavobacterium rhamnosiphilum]|uniref:Outer membrane protein beta-barrel domain-containing protein n=1 Tax=Flavobacterium rhamnosiphilum TaxID=2541724 RepID=A0A4R5FCQ0_9FLAO|nr:hypothetical protein [Flavobacterium rhamnosiphilum]TDE46618.1 hypothetical protein E0I26_00615 [Flavobacterium rhamnosiphilum]